MTRTYIGTNKCSRCGGTDSSCYVCGSLSRSEQAAQLIEERRAKFFARQRRERDIASAKLPKAQVQ